MSKLPLDLKHFKKTASDKTHTTLKHKDGHEIRLARSALGKDMQKSLDALPMTEGAEQSNPKLEESKKTPSKPASAPKSPQKLADGGEVDEAADAAKKLSESSPDAPITINIGHPSPAAGPTPDPAAMASFMPPPDANSTPMPGAPNFSYGKQQAEAPMSPPQAAMPAPAAAPQDQSAAQAPQMPLTNQEAPDPYGINAYQNTLTQGISEQKAGLLGEAQAQGAMGREQANVLHQQVAQEQQRANDYNTHYQELDAERKNFQHDIQNQHIDPQRLINSQGIGQRIATGIGLILGGMGGGALGQENPAMAFLNKQIDRDIDAQKTELGKSENLLSANMKQFGNLRDATDMTRVMQNDVIQNQLKEAAAKAASPMAQANALKAIGVLDAQNAETLSKIATRKTMMNALGASHNDPNQVANMIQAMRQINPEMAKEMSGRFIPGVGLAQVEVPQSARDTMIAKTNLAKMAADLYQWSSKNSGNLNPATVNEGKAKAAELQSAYRNAINGGVFKAGEQEFIDHIIDSDPTKFFNNIRTLPKLKEVMNNNAQQLNTLKRGYGLPVSSIQESKPILPKK